MDISTTKDNDTLLTTHSRLWRKAREKWESYQFGVDYNSETYQNVSDSALVVLYICTHCYAGW